MFVLFWVSSHYRTRMKHLLPRVAGAMALLVLVAYVANDITGNYLLYRYQGKSTSEVIIGKSEEEKEYFSGREDILNGELKVFAENPLLGIGMGRGTIYREGEFNSDAVASHTEFSRMLGEHGLLGLLAIVCAFVLLPYKHFRSLRNDDTRQWMLTFFVLSMFTLVHSGMRLALPSVAFGLAFIFIVPAVKKANP
jgi:O-antigen ligase